MKRYTAVFRVGEGGPRAHQVKEALEQELLRSPITHRMGAAAEPAPGTVTVELATDAGKEYLFAVLSGLNAAGLLSLDALGWGWSGEPQEGQPGWGMTGRRDPFARVQPQPEDEETYRYGVGQVVGLGLGILILLAGLTAIALAILGVRSVALLFSDAFKLMTCAVLLWGVFPGFRAAYIESIRLTLKDMELVARPRSRAGRLGWEEVDGLETFAEVCTVRAGQKQLRFPIAPPFGLRRANVLMKTIISRAGLRFVDARFGTGATYKRFDAA